MPRDPHEHIISSRMTGIYESNYLKANSPDGRYGLWPSTTLCGRRPAQAHWRVLVHLVAARRSTRRRQA